MTEPAQKMMGGFFILLLSLSLWLKSGSLPAAGQELPVHLNEFVANPREGPEWIELYNHSDQEFALTGWQLDDQEGGSVPVALSGVIKPDEFLLVEIGTKLNNNGDKVRLLDLEGKVRDSFGYDLAKKGFSFARQSDGGWIETDQLTPGQANRKTPPTPTLTPTPTPVASPSPTPSLPPGSPRPTSDSSPSPLSTLGPTPTPTSALTRPPQIILNEFLANPAAGEEWVELYNRDHLEISLDGWQLDDLEDGGSAPFKLTGTIKPYGFRVFSIGTRLNNSGDTVRLVRPAGEEAERFTFEAVGQGLAWAKVDHETWQLTSYPTPGEGNLIVTPQTPAPTPSLSPLPTLTPDPITGGPDLLNLSQELKTVSPSSPVIVSPSPTISVQLPSFTVSPTSQPEVLGLSDKQELEESISAGIDEAGKKAAASIIAGGGLLILAGLVLIGREDMIRFGRALLNSLAARLHLVFADLPPFEHPEDIARRQSGD